MTEQGSGGDRIGSLSVDIIADLTPLEGAKGRVADVLAGFQQELRIKVNASELTNVKAAAKAVSAALAEVQKTAANAPASGATKLKFSVDTAKIRADLDAAFREPFKIKIQISNLDDIRRQIGETIPIQVQHHGVAGGIIHNVAPQEQQHAAPQPRSMGAARGDIENNPDLKKAIHQLYNDFDRHLQIAGKGSLGPSTDDATVKFGRMVDRFGGHLNDFITVNEKGRTTGGALSKAALTAQGIPSADATAINALGKDFQRLARQTTLFTHVREGPEATASPVVMTALHQAEATARTSSRAVEQALTHAAATSRAQAAGFDTSTLLGRTQAAAAGKGPLLSGPPGARVLQNDLSDTLRQFAEVTQSVGRVSTAAARRRRGGSTTAFEAGASQFGGGTAAPEPQQEAASAGIQANRQLVGRLSFMQGGTPRDMSGLARAAQTGIFSRLGRETGGQKRLVELSTEDLEAFDKITAAGRKVSGRRATIGGREIERVDPFKEFVNQAEALYGPEARPGIENSPTIKQSISRYLSAGARNAAPAEGIEYRMTGEYGRNTPFGSGMGRAGTGFSGATVDAAKMERLQENVMGAQRASNPDYMAAIQTARRLHGAASRASIEAGTGLSRMERETHATEIGVSGQRLSPAEIQAAVRVRDRFPAEDQLAIVREIQRRVAAQTEGGMGPNQMGDRAGQRAVREAWTDVVGELNKHLGLGLNMQTSPSRLRKQLSTMGLDIVNAAQGAAYGEINTGELFANQDINRMRQEGGGDRLGTEMEGGVNGKRVYMPTAPLTPGQVRAGELRRGRSERFQAYQQNILAPGGEAVTGRDKPLTDVEKQYIAQQAQEQKDVYAQDTARIDAELATTRQALAYISKQSGYGFEEVGATTVGARANVGGQMKPVYGGRKIRAVEHREDPFFKLVPPNPEAYGKQADVLRARLKKLTAGGATLTPENTAEAQDVQRQLEQSIMRSRLTATGADREQILAGLGESGLPEGAQNEVKAFFRNRTLAGLGQPARRAAARGATSAQMRERFLLEKPRGAGLFGEAPIVRPWTAGSETPYAVSSQLGAPEMTAAPGGPGGGGHSVSGGGPGGGGGRVIDVRIVQSIPLTFAGGGGGGGARSGAGMEGPITMYPQSGVIPGEPGPGWLVHPNKTSAGGGAGGGGRRPRGTPTGATPPPPTPTGEYGEGFPKINILRAPKTGPLPESMSIRMVPKAAVSAEQREVERQQRQADAAARAGTRAKSTARRVSGAELEALGIPVPAGYDTPTRLTRGLNPFVAQARAAARQASSSLPQRALGTSMIQIAENFFGGREGPLSRLANLNNRIADVEGLAGRGDVLRQTRGQTNIARRAALQSINTLAAAGAPIPAKLTQAAGELTKRLTELHVASRVNTKDLKDASAEVTKLAKSAVTGSDILRNLAAGAVGGVVGGLATGGVAMVGQAAIQVAGETLGPLIEKMTGFAGTTARVTGALADATRANQGNVVAVVANQAAQIGLSKANLDAIGPAVQQRVAIEAGNKNLTDQVDLLRTAQNIQRGGQSGPLGFLQPGGGIPGLTRSTGGFLGSDVGATPSTLETLMGQLPGRDQLSQAFPMFSTIANTQLGGVPNLLSGISSQNELNSPQGQDTLKFFNNQLEKAGSSLKLLSSATDEQIAASSVALKTAGATQDQIDQFNRDRLAIVGPDNAPVAANQGKQFLVDLNRGAQLPDPETMLAGMQKQIRAQVDQTRRDLAQSLQNNQANTAVGLLAQPIAPLGRGLLAANTPANVRAMIQGAQGQYDIATNPLTNRAAQGNTALDNLRVPPGVRADLEAVGKQIDAIMGDMAQRQATNFWIDYNHNVTLAKRNVADLVGLTGRTSTSVTGVGTVQASRVGVLENQNLRLTRESQVLGFTQAQNQLNFQTAMAGFSAPGLTGEERAARMEQAKRETAIQQRQLDIGKTVSANQYEITTTLNQRAFDDAKFQLESLPRDLDLQVHIQLDQQQMAVLEQNRQNITADIQAYATAGNAFISMVNSTLTTLEAAGDLYFKGLAQSVQDSFAQAFGTDPFHVGTPTGTGAGRAGGGSWGTPTTPATDPMNPTGKGDTGGPGNVTPMGQGGVIVQINGGTFTDEQSRQGLIRDVSAAVQTGMDRKASLIGLRTPR